MNNDLEQNSIFSSYGKIELLKNLEATGEVAFIIEDNKVSIK